MIRVPFRIEAIFRRHTQNELRDLEWMMLDMVNKDRRSNSLEAGHAKPLLWDERTASIARGHSHDMIRRHFFSHENPDGEGFLHRLSGSGNSFTTCAENIAKGYLTIGKAQEDFMNEPPFEPNHRGNILNAEFTHVGIGVAQDKNGTLTITQDFIRTGDCSHVTRVGGVIVESRSPKIEVFPGKRRRIWP